MYEIFDCLKNVRMDFLGGHRVVFYHVILVAYRLFWLGTGLEVPNLRLGNQNILAHEKI